MGKVSKISKPVPIVDLEAWLDDVTIAKACVRGYVISGVSEQQHVAKGI